MKSNMLYFDEGKCTKFEVFLCSADCTHYPLVITYFHSFAFHSVLYIATHWRMGIVFWWSFTVLLGSILLLLWIEVTDQTVTHPVNVWSETNPQPHYTLTAGPGNRTQTFTAQRSPSWPQGDSGPQKWVWHNANSKYCSQSQPVMTDAEFECKTFLISLSYQCFVHAEL